MDKYNLFQLGLCHLMGCGISVCLPKAQLSIQMAAPDAHAASTVAALGDRLFATANDRVVTTDGQEWQNVLQGVSNEGYFSARVRAFQKYIVGLAISGEHSRLTSDFEGAHLFLRAFLSNLRTIGSRDLLDLKDQRGRTTLHYACMGAHKDVVRLVLEEGGEKLKTAKDKDGCTPLHLLVMFSDEDINDVANLLVDADNIDATSGVQELPHHSLTLKGTPLHWAVLTRNKHAVRVLLELEANIEACYDDRTPLDLAVEFHLYDIVDILLSHGASFESGSGFGRKSMHLIAGNASIVQRRLIHGWDFKRAAALTLKRLEMYGCDINSRDEFMNTPLHRAVASPFERGDLYIIKLLLGNGTDRNAQNDDGDCILHLALKLAWCDKPNDKDIMRLLVDPDLSASDIDIDPNLRDSEGLTPLLLSGFLGVADHLRLLATVKGIDLLARNNNGKSFIEIAGDGSGGSFSYLHAYLQGMERKGLGALPGLNRNRWS